MKQATAPWFRRVIQLCITCLPLWMAAPALAQYALKVNIPDVAPWTIRDHDGLTGIQVELMKELARRCKLRLEIVPIVYVRIAEGLKMGSADMAVAVDSPPLHKVGQKLGLFLSVRTIIIGHQGAPAANLQALQGKKLGIVRGTWYDERIANNDLIFKHNLVNIQQGVQMVAARRIDYVVGTDRALHYAMDHSGKARNLFSEPLDVGKLDFALFARKDLPEDVVRRVKLALAELAKSAEKKTILARY